eukprot:scaffold274440_cov19-Tisochrysis_lutea.AAC.1
MDLPYYMLAAMARNQRLFGRRRRLWREWAARQGPQYSGWHVKGPSAGAQWCYVKHWVVGRGRLAKGRSRNSGGPVLRVGLEISVKEIVSKRFWVGLSRAPYTGVRVFNAKQ